MTPFQRFFRAPVRFDQEKAALVFSTQCLKRPLPSADPDLHRLIEAHVQELDRSSDRELPDQMRRLLRTLLLNQQCSADQIARLFSMHRRTLNRRLQQEGTGFRALLEETRYQMARQLTSKTRISLAQIAAALDYSDASAFTRAFRRWAGTSPTEWRTRQTAISAIEVVPTTPEPSGAAPQNCP